MSIRSGAKVKEGISWFESMLIHCPMGRCTIHFLAYQRRTSAATCGLYPLTSIWRVKSTHQDDILGDKPKLPILLG